MSVGVGGGGGGEVGGGWGLLGFCHGFCHTACNTIHSRRSHAQAERERKPAPQAQAQAHMSSHAYTRRHPLMQTVMVNKDYYEQDHGQGQIEVGPFLPSSLAVYLFC